MDTPGRNLRAGGVLRAVRQGSMTEELLAAALGQVEGLLRGMRVVVGLLGDDAPDAPGWARAVRVPAG